VPAFTVAEAKWPPPGLDSPVIATGVTTPLLHWYTLSCGALAMKATWSALLTSPPKAVW
jgi:hypothetical protein